MQADLISFEEVKLFLRLDDDEEDALLATLIGAATEAVLDYADNWDQTTEVPDRLKLAVLMHVARAYTNREDGADAPPSAGRLLFPLRKLDL